MAKNNLLRMDNVSIVVELLDEAVDFFTELGLKLEGRGFVDGEWAGRVTGLGDQNVEVAMMVTPDGHSRLELSRFLRPPVEADHRKAPVNALGYQNSYKLCYIRGPEEFLSDWQSRLLIIELLI